MATLKGGVRRGEGQGRGQDVTTEGISESGHWTLCSAIIMHYLLIFINL